jgi:hypothetical protein
MIRMDLTNNDPFLLSNTLWDNFSRNIANQHRSITVDMVNEALVEYNATYHYKEIGNLFESSYQEWIDFKNNDDYIMFKLRWA